MQVLIPHTEPNHALGYRLVLHSKSKPTLEPHQLLIAVHAAGVNRADIYQAQGKYRPPEHASPFLGLEVSGVVEAVGEAVKTLSVGEEVCALTAGGGYGQYVAAEEWRVLPKPQALSMEEAAAIPEALFTVYAALWEKAALRPSDTLLLHGGAGGIGSTAIQMVAALGGRVIATAGSEEKCQFCLDLGAHQAINYRTQTLEEELAKESVDVVLDSVGGRYINPHMNVLKHGGRYVSIGLMDGSKAETHWGKILLKNLQITGFTLRSQTDQQIYTLKESLRHQVWPLIEQKSVMPVMDSVYDCSEATEAHLRMLESAHIGKMVLRFL